ncbi:DMT family transporter [Saliniramus sp.]|uniref:DMT family transporter n=1 Tax=Saliniramus sp. TaxID=2986772 RepID=UPI002B825677|nr:DMT family transporter [Saliniramus sp.]HMB09711.1 DMT family transporter [Saliniramus sp.]
MSSPQAIIDNRRGIIAMLCASLFFITNDTVIKLASDVFSTSQMMAVRGVFSTSFALIIVVALGQTRHLRKLASPLVALRATLEATVAFLFITALALLPLANVTAILQSTPIIMTLMLVALGLERVGWRRWGAILVGFAGVLLIVQPSPEGFNISVLFALSAAVLVSIRDLVTRRIADDIPSPVIAASTTMAVGLAGFVIGFVRGEEWAPFLVPEVTYLVVAAALVTMANLAIVMAFRNVEVSVVSPFRYAVVIFALIVGYLVFGDLPNFVAMAGMALVVGAGVYTIHREHVRRRQISALSVARPETTGGEARR